MYPGLLMFFNVHEKNQEGLVDFHDVMDVVCNDTHWYASVLNNIHRTLQFV